MDLIVRDCIFGDIYLNYSEGQIVNSDYFQRQRRIKQLDFTELIYPDATHNRLSHALGVCEAVTRMFDVVQRKTRYFDDSHRELIRAIALVHDLGHTPKSHASESLSTITHEERLEGILKYERKNIMLKAEYPVPAWSVINQVYNGEGTQYLEDKKYFVLRSFMDGFIDADKIDYLLRDATFCGISHGQYDKDGLINSLTLLEDDKGVLQLGIEESGLHSLESFILARYYMYMMVYFHPTKRLYDRLFTDFLRSHLKGGVYPESPKAFLKYDDSTFEQKFFASEYGKSKYELVCNMDYNQEIKDAIDSKLSGCLICDVPRKVVFRKRGSLENLYMKDSFWNRVIPVVDASPILKSIEYSEIHKLRYYAPAEVADSVKKEIISILRKESLVW